MDRVVLLFVLATTALSLHLTEKASNLSEDDVVLVASKQEFDLNEDITIDYQRISNERDAVSEATDFVGLFRKADPTTLAPYDVAVIGESAQTGEIKLRARRAGDMELRIVRVPGQIIGKTAIKVFGPCLRADCSGHGTCVKGTCECNTGWEGEICDLLSGQGASVTWVDNAKSEFYPGDVMRAKISHSHTDVESSGLDVIGVYEESRPSVSVAESRIPPGASETDIYLPHKTGKYILKLTRGNDNKVIATSSPFGVFEACPNDCSGHGRCEEGKCVCDQGFDREDCSRGEGMATVTISDEAYTGTPITVSFTRDETSGVLTDRDWLGVYPVGDETTDNPLYYGFAITEKVYDPDQKALLNTNITNGTVQLLMPYEAGQYVIRYVHQSYAKYFTTPPFTVYTPCSNNCSARGQCAQGQCVCIDNWTGDECEYGIADFTVSVVGQSATQDMKVGDSIKVAFTRPAGNNTDYDFIGLYGQASQNTSHLLYWYAYATADAAEDTDAELKGEVELYLPIEGEMKIRYVNAYTLETEVETGSTLIVYGECPANCSGQGSCFRGECNCKPEWKGADCSLGAGEIELTLLSGDNTATIKAAHSGFLINVKRPLNHYTVGDFISLFPASETASDMSQTLGYAYAKFNDEAEVFVLLNGKAREMPAGTQVEARYMNPSHEVMGKSTPFSLTFE